MSTWPNCRPGPGRRGVAVRLLPRGADATTALPSGGAGASRFPGDHGGRASILALAGAALIIISAIIHLHLWAQGHHSITVIGPLFLAQGVVSIVLRCPPACPGGWGSRRPERR